MVTVSDDHAGGLSRGRFPVMDRETTFWIMIRSSARAHLANSVHRMDLYLV